MSKAARVALRQFMEQGKYTDFSIICNGTVIPVHKVVACANSPVIDASCQSSFKNAGKSFIINEYAVNIVKMMVDFFYAGHYDAAANIDQDAPDQQSEVALHAQMFAIADKYVIPELQQSAVLKYVIACNCEGDIFYFLQSVRIAYTYTPDSVKQLRKAAVRDMCECRQLDALASFESTEAFKQLLDDIPDFAKDVVLYNFWQTRQRIEASIISSPPQSEGDSEEATPQPVRRKRGRRGRRN